MDRSRRLALTVGLAIFVSGAAGCQRPHAKNAGGAGDMTPAQYFRDQQGIPMSSHGKIRLDTVQEKDGQIFYQTDDGQLWTVNHSKRADGTYEYGTPTPAK